MGAGIVGRARSVDMNTISLDFTEETRGRSELGLAVSEALLCEREMADLHGAGDCHIEQSALLLYLLRAHTHLRGKEVLLHAHDIHHGKLQAFGSMHRHKRYARGMVIEFLVLVGQQ